VRVIAGKFKGRRLNTPGWQGLRPTSDKLRETLFNILAPRIQSARVLDGYAGTGALGIEALSRGASSVVFVEADRRAAALIAENLKVCGVKEGYTIHCTEIVSALSRMSGEQFDLALLDPPYDTSSEAIRDVLDAVKARLGPSGLVVLERATRRTPDAPSSLVHVRDVRSGDSTLSVFEVMT
jgi:16S rRNA (guanine966-N2)-methyltransferase